MSITPSCHVLNNAVVTGKMWKIWKKRYTRKNKCGAFRCYINFPPYSFTRRLASRYYQLKTGHALVGSFSLYGLSRLPRMPDLGKGNGSTRFLNCWERYTGRRSLYRAHRDARMPLPTAAERSPRPGSLGILDLPRPSAILDIS